MKLILDKTSRSQLDDKILSSMNRMIDDLSTENIDRAWGDLKNSKFKNHIIGKGGNHLWITRKSDNQRIAIITD